MIRLIAIRQILSGCGSIEAETAFLADDREAARLIKAGDAMPEHQAAARPYSGKGYWTIKPEWKGATAVIVAGGPSVTTEQIDQLGKSDLKVIVVNNAATLVPWADMLYFCDDRWYDWHKDLVRNFGGMRVTLENIRLQSELEVRCVRDYGVTGFAPKSDGVMNGRNGGYQALHIAAWLGAARVLLLGFDMRAIDGQMHWHDEHPIRTPATIFDGWLSCFESLAPELQKRGVEVINCSPGSALKVFPHITLAAALGHEPPVLTAEQIAENDHYIETVTLEPLYAPLPIQYPQTPWPGVHPNQSNPEQDPGPFGDAGENVTERRGESPVKEEESRALSGLRDMLALQNGVPGQDGKDGKDGKDGRNGVDGVDGIDGIDGKDGVDVNSHTGSD